MKTINSILISIIILIVSSCSNKAKDPFPDIQIPVFRNASQVETGYDDAFYGKSVYYDLKVSFPANDVIEFYETFLSGNEFSKLVGFPQAEARWVKFNRKSLEWDLTADGPPAHYFGVWVDKNKNLMFKLTLNYKTSDDLAVICFLHPYASVDRMEEIDKWVKDRGKEQELAILLAKYTKADHKFDYEKALKENPDSELAHKLREVEAKDHKDIVEAYQRYKQTMKNN